MNEPTTIPQDLTDLFSKAGATAGQQGLTWEQATSRDGEGLTAAAQKALGRPMTQWDETILGTAYKLGYRIATISQAPVEGSDTDALKAMGA